MHQASVLDPTPAAAADPLWQRQLGLLLESTGEGIFGIDLAGHCMFLNRAGARMLGWEPAVPLSEGLARTVDYFRGVLNG